MNRFGFDEEDEVDATNTVAYDDSYEEHSLISDTASCVELLSKLISKQTDTHNSTYASIVADIDHIFGALSSVTFDDELNCYNYMQTLCGRLVQQNKIQKLKRKTVIGLGGQFSAGKSKFINSIAGIVDLLPEAQAPTTSIPTYIINSSEERYIANLKNGETVILSREEASAITHEFYNAYSIGFASFIESMILETPSFCLDSELAFLDTPGYSKYDSKSDSDNVLSDKQKALEQLRLADRLIWLVDIDNGTFTKDDLEFLSLLNNEEKILVVLNKADKKTEADIKAVREQCIETAKEYGLNIFGIAAYSSINAEEYSGDLIHSFLKDAAVGTMKKNDIYSQFQAVEMVIGENIEEEVDKLRNDCYKLRDTINESENIINIRSFTQALYTKTIEADRITEIWTDYMSMINKLNCKISKYLSE